MDIKECAKTYYINPGSITIPKQGEASFIIFENEIVKVYNMNKELILEKKFK